MDKVKLYYLSSSSDGTPKYIGITSRGLKTRLYEHNRISRCTKKNKKSNWVASQIKKGFSVNIHLIEEVDESEALIWEEFYIHLFKSWGFELKNQIINAAYVYEFNLTTLQKDKIKDYYKNNSTIVKERNAKALNTRRKMYKEWDKNNVCKQIIQIDSKTNETVNKFQSIAEAARILNYRYKILAQVLRGYKRKGHGEVTKINTYKGFIFKYI